MKPEVWRKTFRFLSIMELVKLRQVCQTFKEEIDFLFTTQDRLCTFDPSRGPVHFDLCIHPRYYVANSSWIRLKNFKKHLPTLKSLFPSVKVLVMRASKSAYRPGVYCELYIEDILDSFVDLEFLAINDDIQCRDTNRSYPKLKYLFLEFIFGASISGLPFLPSLESLHIECDFLEFKPWMEKNFGRPSKRCEIDLPFCSSLARCYSFQCLSSLPSSLEYLKFKYFFGYSRQFKPLFPKLMEVNRGGHGHNEFSIKHGNTEFIDFLKDHRLTLKKVTTLLSSFDDDELKDMLSCLPHGTHIRTALYGLRANQVRQYGLIGGLCRDRNLYLEIYRYDLPDRVDDSNRFLEMLPPETQSLTVDVSHITRNEASCRRLILEIVASPLRSTTLLFHPTEEAKRTWSTAIQGLPETHKAILGRLQSTHSRVLLPSSVIIRRQD